MNDNANWRIGTDWSHIRSDVTTLIFSPGSCALAPHIVLEEIGKPFALTLVSTDQGEARTDKFRNLNPKGRIPVLIKGDWMLTEAPAILLHLANDNPMFAPKGQEEVSRALEWFNWLSGTVHSVAVRQIWKSEYFTCDPDAHEPIREKGYEHLIEAYSLIESRLTEGEWVLNSGYTVLDPFLLVFYRWGHRMKLPMRENCPKWTKHTDLMLDRPAVMRALTSEGISVWE